MSAFSAIDRAMMARALALAERGLFTTTPNPRVGCVIVRDGQVVGEGWHEKAGLAHAEVNALSMAGERARGATVYVTLEPCGHHGRTPPCAIALVTAGVERVVAAMRDPNPVAAGGGDILRGAGIAFDPGLMEDEARELNPGWISRVVRGRPWVRIKTAATLDGRTALANGKSQWITGPEARVDGHRWRARACAIATGSGTVRADDPRLTVRDISTPRQPLRVVVDSRLNTPPTAALLDGGALIFTASDDGHLRDALNRRGAEIVRTPDPDGKVDLAAMLAELGRRGINELHVEGGSRLNGALTVAGLVDEFLVYLAPSFLGDSAQGMLVLPPLADLGERRRLRFLNVERLGEDLRIVARPLAEAGR